MRKLVEYYYYYYYFIINNKEINRYFVQSQEKQIKQFIHVALF